MFLFEEIFGIYSKIRSIIHSIFEALGINPEMNLHFYYIEIYNKFERRLFSIKKYENTQTAYSFMKEYVIDL